MMCDLMFNDINIRTIKNVNYVCKYFIYTWNLPCKGFWQRVNFRPI